MVSFLILTQYFPPEVGAAPVRLFEIARALMTRGHRVQVVTAMPNYPSGAVFPGYQRALIKREIVQGIPVIRTWIYPAGGNGRDLRKRLMNYVSFTVTSIVGCMLASKVDVVLVESPPLFLGLTAFVVGCVRRIPFILNVSDLWPDSALQMGILREGVALRLCRRLEAFLYARAYRVNVVTTSMRDWLIERKAVPASKLAWLPNGANLARFTTSSADREWASRLRSVDSPLFTYVGTFGQVQDLDVLLDAAGLVGDAATFVLVGEGTEKHRLQQRAKALHLSNTLFVDPQPLDEVAHILSVSTAALATVKAGEVFRTVRSAKMLPAMASGKPLIYAGDGEGAKLVRDARCGLVVPPGDPHALAGAVRQILADPTGAVGLGRNGRALVEQEYQWETLVDRWLAEVGLA